VTYRHGRRLGDLSVKALTEGDDHPCILKAGLSICEDAAAAPLPATDGRPHEVYA
jgi:hypothetical protein